MRQEKPSPRRRVIVLGSHNRGKLREIEAILGHLPVEWRTLDAFPQAVAPDETGATFAENARIKALGLARQLGAWVLADDSGLCVDALDGGPGVRSARYAGPGAADAEKVAKLLAELRGVPPERRGAAFVCAVALASPGGVLLETEGRCGGILRFESRGHNGFGYDPIFEDPESGATFAELPEEAKNRISHRGRALRKLAERLPDLLAAHEKTKE